jgi:hypothetical protein
MNGDPTIPHPDPSQPPHQPDPPGTPVPGPPDPGTPPAPIDPPMRDPVPDPPPIRDPPRQPPRARQTVASERATVSAMLEGWLRSCIMFISLPRDTILEAMRVEPYATI